MPSLFVVVEKLQPSQSSCVRLPLTVSVELPVVLVLPLIVELEHVSISSPAVSVSYDEPPGTRLRSISVPKGQCCPAGQGSTAVEQSLLAEAVPAPILAAKIMAETAAMPNTFRYFMILPLPPEHRAPERICYAHL